MLDKFLAFIEKHELFKKEDHLLVAVSGGKDSVVLTDLLSKGLFKATLAHCNFNLRPKESDEDEVFVKDIAKQYGFAVYTNRFDTNKHAEENGISIQMAARNLRYDWFNQLRKEIGANYIVTAHQLNDSLETALFNFVKGTGVAGLRGIKAQKNSIVRPLLFATRAEINGYAKDYNILWREDSSNASNKYHRNKIRQEVLPILKKINPSLENTFLNTSDRMLSTERLIESAVSNLRLKVFSKDTADTISIDTLLDQELVVLEQFLIPYGFNFSQTQELKELLRNKQAGKVLQSSTHLLNVDREKVFISVIKHTNFDQIEVKRNMGKVSFYGKTLELESTDDLQIRSSLIEAKVDLDRLTFPLILRKWKQGDSFQPLGMKGKKKLSDFMIDEKIPLNLKSEVVVLLSDNKIVWVVGRRIDDRFKITSQTTQALHLKLSHD